MAATKLPLNEAIIMRRLTAELTSMQLELLMMYDVRISSHTTD